MRKVFLLTGFNNWGKSWLIKGLFGRQVFYKNSLYQIRDHRKPNPFAEYDFFVLQASNDDLGEQGYVDEFNERLMILGDVEKRPDYIVSAFCPTREIWNDSKKIISTLYLNDEIIMIPIEYKWCDHAKLLIAGPCGIHDFYSNFHQRLKIEVLAEKDCTKKLDQLKDIIQRNLS